MGGITAAIGTIYKGTCQGTAPATYSCDIGTPSAHYRPAGWVVPSWERSHSAEANVTPAMISNAGAVTQIAAERMTNYIEYKMVNCISDENPFWVKLPGTGTSNCYSDWTYSTDIAGCKWWHIKVAMPLAPADRLREIIRSRSAPFIIGCSKSPVKSAEDLREERARETLRRILGDEKYRRYLVRGFVAIRARSGLIYQLYPGHRQAHILKNGQLIETACIILTGNYPPTDWLIMRYLLLLNDEADFRRRANITKSGYLGLERIVVPAAPVDQRPLAEILRDLRRDVAAPTSASRHWTTV